MKRRNVTKRIVRVASTTHPMQPVILDEGVARFKENKIVVYLLDQGKGMNNGTIDMNTLAALPFSDEDRNQFAQLIGYSVSGYGELSYADPKMVAKADFLAARLEK